MKRGEGEAARRRARRQRVAAEAARQMAVHGLQDSREAARRAARLLGADEAHDLPGHAEVVAELLEYQRLFQRDSQPAALQQRREAAVEAMAFLAGFDPLLYGPVLEGSADEHSPVQLQVFAEDPDAFARFMLEQAWPQGLRTANKRLQLRRDGHQDFTSWRFAAEGIEFEVVALPPAMQRQAPLGPDGKPMARASLSQLRALLAEKEKGSE